VLLLNWCRQRGLPFAIVVPRYRTMWEARRHIAPNSWRPPLEMTGAEVAELTFIPAGWIGEPWRLLVRRVRVEADEISRSPQSRRRRTMPEQQLRLALRGAISHTYSYSFLATDLPGDAAELEHGRRRRAQIEERIKDLKLGCGLLHRPLRKRRANLAWQTAAVIAGNLAAMLSAVDVVQERRQAEAALGRALNEEEVATVGRPHHPAVVRRWLLVVPARLVRSARRLQLRLAQGMFHKQQFWALHRLLLSLAPTG